MSLQTARRTKLLLAATLLLTVTAAANAETWRIAIGGGRITGYVGTLANAGIHHEVLQDNQLLDGDTLALYDIVIVTPGVANPSGVSAAIEKYVADGGIAITEVRVQPSTAVAPGQRLGPAAGPNLRFTGYDHPISKSMARTGLVAVQAQGAAAIIPAEGAGVVVLAEFTDDQVNKKYAGKLTGGRKHVPAMLLIKHGQGQWLYSGANIAMSLALRGPTLQPWVLASLKYLSGGDVVPRFSPFTESRWLVPKFIWQAQPAAPAVRKPVQDAEPAPLPEGFEDAEVPADSNEAFVLTGEVMTGDTAEVLLSWFNHDWQRSLRLDENTISVVEVTNGRERVVREAPRPPTSESLAQILIRRRPASVTVFVDGAPALLAAVDAMQGQVATNGIMDAFCQPTAPVYFDDDFMRAGGEASSWETPVGKWELHEVGAEAYQGANPFAFKATGEGLASAVVGHWFWDDYDISCAVRSEADAVGIYAHYQAPDDCLLLRLTYPRADDEQAYLSLARLTPEGKIRLASADVEAHRKSWHRLRIRASGGHVVAELDGREVARVADDLVRGAGQVGLFTEVGSALFDDVTVQPWEALPLPIGADGPWAWDVDRGKCTSGVNRLALTPNKSARALAPIGEQVDLRASALVQLHKASSAGLLLRYQGPGDYYRVTLARAKKGAVVRAVATVGGEETVLAEAPVRLASKGALLLTAVVSGETIRAMIDDETILTVADAAHAVGRVGLYCAGRGPAVFSEIEFEPLDPIDNQADPPTPPYAGIIDQHTWAGRGSGWTPRPEDPDLFWHRGLFTDTVEVRLGVHRAADGHAGASLMVGDGGELDSGYRLTADQSANGQALSLKLLREGAEVAAETLGAPESGGYALGLERTEDLLIARVDGEVALTFRDPNPLADAVRVGMGRDACLINPSDADVISSDVRTYTFKTAPVEMANLSGTWDISNRWSCSPNWTWLAGWNQNGEARAATRQSYVGDQQIDIHVGTKMMPKPTGKGHYEELRDLLFGLCESEDGGGYRIIVGGKSGTYSTITRDGQVVASNRTWALQQSERHNNWILVTLSKIGPVVSVKVWGYEVLRYEDPKPLEGGRIAIGTNRNGITIPRITIYGQETMGGPERPPDEA